MTQSIADEALLSFDSKWHSSKDRQDMVARWLSLERSELDRIFSQYMYFSKSIETRQYSVIKLKKQLEDRLSQIDSSSQEWKCLNYTFQVIVADMYSEENEAKVNGE